MARYSKYGDTDSANCIEILVLFTLMSRACLHFKNGDKNEINCSQTRKIAPLISGYYLAI